MDDQRALLIAIAASLARQQIRLLDKNIGRRSGAGQTTQDPHWTAADLSPPSAWLDATPPQTALGGVIGYVARTQAHLLGMVESPDPVDGKRACYVLQHLACNGSTWGTLVLRLARQLGVELAPTPLQEFSGVNLIHESLPSPGRKQHRTGN